MIKLLSIEWLKVKKYRTFWILIGFFIVLLPLWNLGITDGFLKFGGKNDINILDQAYTFEHVWANLGFWASIFVIFISILTIIITTNEYSFRTSRQNVIDGLSKLDFFHAKWFMVLLFTFFTGLYVFIVGVYFGATKGSISDFPGEIKQLGYLVLLALNYYSFALLIAFLFKRSGIAIGMFILYTLVLESMIKGIVNWGYDTEIGNYLPLQASDELLPFPLMKAVKDMAGMGGEFNATPYLIMSLVWILSYYIIGRLKILRSDW
ncbi:MAG: ABC transporter permease [Flavipsychrobacter sp.]